MVSSRLRPTSKLMEDANNVVIVYWDQPYNPADSNEAQVSPDLNGANEDEGVVR